MHWLQTILLASDATLAGLAGGCLALLALAALAMDLRRARRRDLDAVGIMPWTTIFMLSSMAAAILLVLALTGWLGG